MKRCGKMYSSLNALVLPQQLYRAAIAGASDGVPWHEWEDAGTPRLSTKITACALPKLLGAQRGVTEKALI
jgi:hypothetical protein